MPKKPKKSKPAKTNRRPLRVEACEVCACYGNADPGKCDDTGDAMPPEGHCEEFRHLSERTRTRASGEDNG